MAKNEIQKTESPLTTAAALVAANGNMEVGKLKELLDLQERWDATQAKKAYVQAMSEFKANPPEILKDKTVEYGTTKYKHASLHNVTTCINKALSEHGLTAGWVTSQDNGNVKVTCKITHIQGHSEETCLSAAPDLTGSKNPIQAIGSTVKYFQRYTLLALTGLATHEQEDDGKPPGNEPTTKPTKKEEQNAIVDQAFFDFECEQKDVLLEGFVYSREKFEAAIIKHFKSLPTRKESIKKILELVKPEEVMEEVPDYSDAPEYEE